MKENKFSFSVISLKTTIVHTVSYFVIGILALTFLDYSAKFADPIVANMFRQTDHPLVAAGPLFQVLRGFLFGVVFYALREIIFPRKNGWLLLWLVLVILGIISPFGAAPSSIEGMVYTVLPTWFHVVGLPEVFVQSGLLAFLTHYWVNHPEKNGSTGSSASHSYLLYSCQASAFLPRWECFHPPGSNGVFSVSEPYAHRAADKWDSPRFTGIFSSQTLSTLRPLAGTP